MMYVSSVHLIVWLDLMYLKVSIEVSILVLNHNDNIQ